MITSNEQTALCSRWYAALSAELSTGRAFYRADGNLQRQALEASFDTQLPLTLNSRLLILTLIENIGTDVNIQAELRDMVFASSKEHTSGLNPEKTTKIKLQQFLKAVADFLQACQ